MDGEVYRAPVAGVETSPFRTLIEFAVEYDGQNQSDCSRSGQFQKNGSCRPLSHSCTFCAEALWIPLGAALLLIVRTTAFAQTQSASTPLQQEGQLERDFTDPLSTAPSDRER